MYPHLVALFALLITPLPSSAATGSSEIVNLTASAMGILSVLLFVAAYVLVMFEEQLHLRKSKPVMVAAGIIWILVAISYQALGKPDHAHAAVMHNLSEYVELFLFLLAAMTYINALEERNAFLALRSWLVNKGFSLRQLFWMTGLLAFFISPVADNLTTALLMGAVVMAVGANNPTFMVVSCINIVIAANAGGAFSPFGDITTLMVWQKGKVEFFGFFALFIPSLINWLVPAVCMSLAVPKGKPQVSDATVRMKLGAKRIMALFLLTIVTAVSFHNFLHLPPAIGMMLGMGYLSLFAYYLIKVEGRILSGDNPLDVTGHKHETFDLFRKVAKAEWDTLLFFYGVILCVGGLGQFGYLAMTSTVMYDGLGQTTANIMIGILSAFIDNIPVMFAVLTMDPQMSVGQWLLVTLTAGVGGSLLSIGSAAGVALMGTARGVYTFGSHLKWTWAIGLGYAASIAAHMFMNARLFTG
ncbi:MAG: sodium:proton antiporter NhaD [Thiobacillaceae bacterium]|nr:sodium:proton antiporter NhaD [Thiobacillaceae bacterium]